MKNFKTVAKNKFTNAIATIKRDKKQILASFVFCMIMMTIDSYADFWTDGVDGLKKFIKGIGIVLGIWGLVSLGEGYANDNPAGKNTGIKQLVSGGAIFFLVPKLLDQLSSVFN